MRSGGAWAEPIAQRPHFQRNRLYKEDIIVGWIFAVMSVVIPILICRIAGIILLRFEVGRVIITFASKLMWLFPIGIIGNIIGNAHLALFNYFAVLMFLKMPVSTLLQSIYQLVGMIVTPIMNKFNLPSKENYVLKGDYILPFTEKWTVVNGGVNKDLSHSWSILPQRYAYDFIIVDDNGKSSLDDRSSVHSYYCYGKDIIAPADGVIVNLIDKYTDSFVDGKNGYCNANRIEGNSIVIKHNDSEYSTIAHILRGSFKVKVGDTVKQGEVIAKCGNTGNSSEPHIHFQLQSGKNFFLSAGLPIAFSDITAQDKENYKLLDKRPCGDNLQVFGNKSYIGRGLEVENSTI